ncbi:MAG TPA: LacI family DNA-binding transcriptional regulator [Phycisphaeraceae bacterium]
MAPSSPNAVTLQMIADKVGLSPSTVSVVLNGKARERKIAPATERRILKAASELKYQPNFFASQLRRSSSRLLMICLQQLRDLHSSATAESFVQRAAERGYHVVLSAFLDEPDPMRVSDEVLGTHGVPALAVVGSASGILRGEMLDRWLKRGVQVVSIEHKPSDSRVSCVLTDEFTGGLLAGRHVYEQGVQKVWVLAGEQSHPFTERVEGYRAAAAEASAPEPILLWTGPSRLNWSQRGYEAVREALKRHDPPDALLGVGGMITVAGTRALVEAGLVIGRDVSVVSYHTGELGQFFSPPLTSVDPPVHEAGAAAADLLIDMLEGKRRQGETVKFKPSITIRESSRWQGRRG